LQLDMPCATSDCPVMSISWLHGLGTVCISTWSRQQNCRIVVTLVVTSMSRRAIRQARHSTSRLFSVPKCMG